MSLQFISGGSGAGKSEYLSRLVCEESVRRQHDNFIEVVPEQYTMETQKKLVHMHSRKGILNIDVVMQYCLEVAFSKIVLIFLYYVLINRLIKRTEAACSREQYIIYGIMFFYSLVNMLVIVQNFRDGQKSYLSADCTDRMEGRCRMA